MIIHGDSKGYEDEGKNRHAPSVYVVQNLSFVVFEWFQHDVPDQPNNIKYNIESKLSFWDFSESKNYNHKEYSSHKIFSSSTYLFNNSIWFIKPIKFIVLVILYSFNRKDYR